MESSCVSTSCDATRWAARTSLIASFKAARVVNSRLRKRGATTPTGKLAPLSAQ